MGGGMSHLDTFDPKPEQKDIQGPVGVIDTNVASGVLLARRLVEAARVSWLSFFKSKDDGFVAVRLQLLPNTTSPFRGSGASG